MSSFPSPAFSSAIPSPDLFCRYLASVGADPARLNTHFWPAWLMCPLCSVPWDAVGHLETFGDDSEFVRQALGVQGLLRKLKTGRRVNASDGKGGDDSGDERLRPRTVEEFRRELEPETLEAIKEMYSLDYAITGYDPNK